MKGVTRIVAAATLFAGLVGLGAVAAPVPAFAVVEATLAPQQREVLRKAGNRAQQHQHPAGAVSPTRLHRQQR